MSSETVDWNARRNGDADLRSLRAYASPDMKDWVSSDVSAPIEISPDFVRRMQQLPEFGPTDNRALLNTTELAINPRYYASVEGSARVARRGDTISRFVGSSDPQAIGNFMRTNDMANSNMFAGQSYFIPADSGAYGTSTALGQRTLNADNWRSDATSIRAAFNEMQGTQADRNADPNYRDASVPFSMRDPYNNFAPSTFLELSKNSRIKTNILLGEAIAYENQIQGLHPAFGPDDLIPLKGVLSGSKAALLSAAALAGILKTGARQGVGSAGKILTAGSGSISYGTLDDLGRPTGIMANITQDMIKTGTSANPKISPLVGQATVQNLIKRVGTS